MLLVTSSIEQQNVSLFPSPSHSILLPNMSTTSNDSILMANKTVQTGQYSAVSTAVSMYHKYKAKHKLDIFVGFTLEAKLVSSKQRLIQVHLEILSRSVENMALHSVGKVYDSN